MGSGYPFSKEGGKNSDRGEPWTVIRGTVYIWW